MGLIKGPVLHGLPSHMYAEMLGIKRGRPHKSRKAGGKNNKNSKGDLFKTKGIAFLGGGKKGGNKLMNPSEKKSHGRAAVLRWLPAKVPSQLGNVCAHVLQESTKA